MNARLIQIGETNVGDPEIDPPVEFAMVIQFDSREELHEALEAGEVKFETWE